MTSAPTPAANAILHGRAILVTRPAAQAARLCRLVADAGGEAVAFPTIEILSTWNEGQGQSYLSSNNLISVQMLVFVSPTAVAEGLAALAAGGTDVARLAARLQVAAVGRGTAAALARHGVRSVIVPAKGADSEALAALPELQAAAVAGRSILIVRGEGGREWLADTLRARGARVAVAECYRRGVPQVAAAELAALAARWCAGGIAAVTVHSRGALDNLLTLLPTAARAEALRTPLFASHPRIAEHARVLGLQQVHVAGPGDDEMMAGIAAFFAKVRP